MQLIVIGRSVTWDGKTYPTGAPLEIDETAHNARARIRMLKAAKLVADAPGVFRKAADVRRPEPPPAPAELDFESGADADTATSAALSDLTEVGPELIQPLRRGRYGHRRLQAED